MQAADLSHLLRRTGLVFIVCLFLSIRVDGRLILLPLQAAVMAWQLYRLGSMARSPEAWRAWRGAFVAAGLCGIVGVLGFSSAIDPSLITTLSSILVLFGVVSYCSLLSHWAGRAGWADARRRFDRARLWAVANLAALAASLLLLFLLGDRPTPAQELDDVTVLLGRVADGWGSVLAIVVLAVLWIGTMIVLQGANRVTWKGLGEQADADVPLA